MTPNLFNYATSELSQDAFICWLLSWSDPACEESETSLHCLGVAFLAKLLGICNVSVPATIKSVKVQRQYKDIDILAIVNDSIALLIEDKTGTRNHSDQLQLYRQIIESDFPQHTVAAVYFKTGDQCSYDSIREAGYSCFVRSDFLELLEQGRERAIHNSIYSDFLYYLSHIEERVTDYRRLSVLSWHWDCWKGFFTELRQRLGHGEWDYVPNRSGGFMGYLWHRRDNKYLQLENEKLCFKIQVVEKPLQAASWEAWNRVLMAESSNQPLALVRPRRRRNGTWMTVALLEADYRQQDDNGLLDMNKTIDILRSAESYLDHVAGSGTR